MIDQKTTNFDFPLPHPSNTLADDVLRLRTALGGIDDMFNWAAGLLDSNDPLLGKMQAVVDSLKSLTTVLATHAHSGTGTAQVPYANLSGAPTLGTAAAKDVGSGTGTVCAGDDARLSNARTPTVHKSSHATGGADALSAADIGAMATSHAANSIIGFGSSATALATSQAAGTATTVARSDHVHPYPTAAAVGAMSTGHAANSITGFGTSATALGASQSPGTATTISRSDHVHPSPVSGAVVGDTDTQTLTNKTLTNPTVTNYTETLYAATGNSFTISLVNGTMQKLTTNNNTTVTLPSSVAGKSYSLLIAYGGTHTLGFSGGSTLKWPGGTVPNPQSASGKFDLYTFFCDGTNTYGSLSGRW